MANATIERLVEQFHERARKRRENQIARAERMRKWGRLHRRYDYLRRGLPLLKAITCFCEKCPKCKRRAYMRNLRARKYEAKR